MVLFCAGIIMYMECTMIVFVSTVQINVSCLIQLQLTSLAITVCSPFLIRKIFLGIYQCCHADHATSSRDCFYGDTKVRKLQQTSQLRSRYSRDGVYGDTKAGKLQQTSQLRSRYIPTVVSSTRLHAPTSRAISQRGFRADSHPCSFSQSHKCYITRKA